jgi:NAD(P)-dependent dehydrogenase (short-subunit alcohol dehydrogenase family)
LGKKNFAVWLACRDQRRGEQAAAELRKDGIEAFPLVLDVTSDDSVRAAAEVVTSKSDRLDVLVNNAGISVGAFPAPPLSQESVDDIRKMFETNVMGPLRVTQAFLPLAKFAKELLREGIKVNAANPVTRQRT